MLWLRGTMDNALPLQCHVEGLGFDSRLVRLLSFFRSHFVLFCLFFEKKHIGSVLQHQFIRKSHI